MVMLGLLSLIHLFFLPGWLIASVGLGWLPRMDRALLVAPLSIVTCYCLVASLTLTGIYTQETVLAFFVFEALLVLSLMRDERNTEGAREPLRIADLVPDYAGVLLILFALACGVLVFLQMKTAFAGEEYLMFWDRWADDWYQGHLPHATGLYPQMLPTISSMTYMFMGNTDEKLFACLLPACWIVATALIWSRMATLLPAYRREIQWGFVVLIVLTILSASNAFSYGGFSSFLVVFFVSVIGYALLLSSATSGRKHIWLFKLTTFITAGAAVTQPSGVYLALSFPLVWYIHTGRGRQSNTLCRKLCIKAFTLVMLIAGSWYLYKYMQISQGVDSAVLTDMQIIERSSFSLRNLSGKPLVSLDAWVVWLAAAILSLFSPLSRRLLAWSLPGVLLIGTMPTYFSYGDTCVLLPAMAIVSTLGISQVLDFIRARL